MKKLIAMIMMFLMCLSFVACATDVNTDINTNSQNTSGQQQSQQKDTDYVSAIYFKINPEFKIQLDENNFVVNLECLNDDAKNIFCDINVVGMKGITAIDVLLTTVFNSGVLKEDVTVYVLPYYQKENDLAS